MSWRHNKNEKGDLLACLQYGGGMLTIAAFDFIKGRPTLLFEQRITCVIY